MHPAPGDRCLRFVGDRIRFALRAGSDPRPEGWRAYLRTNLGRAQRVREEIIDSYTSKLPSAGASWRDVAMREGSDEWWLELPLVEVGYFQAKAYLVDATGRQCWPDGPNVGITVHPDQYRTGNTIYCAFVRMFGDSKTAVTTVNEPLESQLVKLDKQGYTVIPPSGKLRDIVRQLPHIVDTLGCRILHLLPINPTPTTYARFGRFGCPYASQDLMAVDPALVEFDRRTTGIDQFRELTYAAHLRGARVFLDIVTNHTGWGSTLQENHPEWFLRGPDGKFASPGAWGMTWEDLVELDHRNPVSWEHLAEVFLTWCRRGVDGFRCDAGYKVPMPAWRYITACVRQEYPETIFLLEGLGGSWEATETLLTDGGMQWAYSELFQNYSGGQVATYLDYAHRQAERAGLYVHYSETHDNERLAKLGRAWSLLRNRLSGLASVSGGYGFTCGVEWLAPEQINVHSSRGMNWGSTENLNSELSQLNRLLVEHPCFFDNARLTRLSSTDSPVYALRRDSEEDLDHVLVLANTDGKNPQDFALVRAVYSQLGEPRTELLAPATPRLRTSDDGVVVFTLLPGACHCLAVAPKPAGLAGDPYRRARACAAFALRALSQVLPVEEIGSFSWRALAERVDRDPERLLAVLRHLDPAQARTDLLAALDSAMAHLRYPQVVVWEKADVRRVLLVPSRHWLLVRDDFPFRASLISVDGGSASPAHSIQVQNGFVAFFPPQTVSMESDLLLERYALAQNHLSARIRFLGDRPDTGGLLIVDHQRSRADRDNPMILLTNGRGGMARLCSDLGRIKSKYDCLVGANLHPSAPVDRHIFAKRVRAWVIADRFITPLDQFNLALCDPGPPARWSFVANAGDGRTVDVQLEVDLLEDRNSTVLRFARPASPSASATDLPDSCDVRLTVRIDLEDRNFHWETKRNGGADHHFSTHCRSLRGRTGFEFTPAEDRQLRVYADAGDYHPEPEWSENIPHPVEKSRGQTASGDAYSPGWFDLPLSKGTSVTLVVCADPDEPPPQAIREFAAARVAANEARIRLAQLPNEDAFGRRLALAAHQFVVRRGEGKTVIAGYPWFLDWGRDTFICARGLLSAGLVEPVRQMLTTFGRFEENGTLPNSIYGEDASNRDTSDAPLWFGLVCEEAAPLHPASVYDLAVNNRGRTLRDVLLSIGEGYRRGTPNGIRVDPDSGLVWSPSHFTWMDTNYPAGTPREGYPVEIQVLWIRLLRQLARIDLENPGRWQDLTERSHASLLRLFWLEDKGYLADCLLAGSGQSAASATVDTALRSNGLFAVSLGLLSGEPARRCVHAALQYLLVPGALRSLAPLPVTPPLPISGRDGRLLNNPLEPYWGRYEGDEDTQRKSAYHNGTAWTWTFPTFCEALVRAWDSQSTAVSASKAYLSSLDRLLSEGCLGQIPEILDGDAPHTQRGCDAQAWGVTEALRVWKWLAQEEAGRTVGAFAAEAGRPVEPGTG
jgi:starch synthase (maltosyl-transferring)